MPELAQIYDQMAVIGMATATNPVLTITAADSQTMTAKSNAKIQDLDPSVIRIIPAGLGFYSTILLPPATGSATLRCAAGVTVNGSNADISLTRATYPKGVSLVPTRTADTYLL
jgi:hypothetical protein